MPHLPLPSPAGLLMLAGTLLLSLALVYLLTLWSYATALLSPPRMTDGKALVRLGRLSPADLGYPFEPLSLPASPGEPSSVPLAAWWIPAPAPSDRTAILVHGYADAKVGALAWAPFFRDLGYNLLLPDLRAHGESGGKYTTAGELEAADLARLLSHLRARQPRGTEHLVLFGASLGAAAIGRFLTHPGLRPHAAGVEAVVLDSPVPSFADGALQHAKLLALPGAWVIRPALVFGQWLTGTEFRHTSLVGNLPELPVPAMLVLPSQDTFLTPKGRQELEHAFSRHLSKHPTATMLACSAPHLMTANLEPEQYHRTLQRFLSLAGRPNLVSC